MKRRENEKNVNYSLCYRESLSRWNKMVILPMPFTNHHSISVPITSHSMPVPISELSLINLSISIFKHTKVQLIIFELALKLITILKLIMPNELNIILPLAMKQVAIFIWISSLSITLAISNPAKVVFIRSEVNAGLAL